MDVRNKTLWVLRDYVYILIGAAITAVSFNVFLLPNKIAAGGVSGISTILQSYGFEAAYVQWIINIPLFIAGVILLGGKFGLKTLAGSVFLPLVVFLTRNIQPATHHELLAAIFGGVGIGVGIGIVYLGKGSTGEQPWLHRSFISTPACHWGSVLLSLTE